MSAAGAWQLAGSVSGAQALLLVGLVLSPPVHEAVARWAHARAPAKVAFFSVITLVPLALAFVAVDGVAMMDEEAKRRGFASAAELGRARDLKVTTPEALAQWDEAALKVERDRVCRGKEESRPLICFAAEHRSLALAFAGQRLDEAEHEFTAREAIDEQRKRLLAADRECQAFLDRVDEDALPVMLSSRPEALKKLAVLWAARLSAGELQLTLERSKPGVSYLSTPQSEEVERKIEALAPQVERQMTVELQAWARRIVLEPTGWQGFLRGAAPAGACKMLTVSQAQ